MSPQVPQDGQAPTARGGIPGTDSWLVRGMGALVLLLTMTPVHLLLDQPGTGGFGESAVMRNSSNLGMAWWGILLATGVGTALTILLPADRIRGPLSRLGRALSTPPIHRFSLAFALAATVLAVLAGQALFQGLPTLVDGMVTRLQARTLAGGLLALDLPQPRAPWLIPNTVLTSEGWVSQYPPFPALLLALGELSRAPWLVFPLLVGGTVFFTTLLAERVLPDRPAVARVSGILLAVSPFLLVLGAGYLSHIPAATFTALTLYAAHRALDGRWGWAILAGAGSGAVVTSRPLLGLVMGVAVPVALWSWAATKRKGGWPWLLSRCSGAVLGGAPFAVGLGLYNRHFFGSATRLGYSVAFGPSHDLGFHTDPWGNIYSISEALGFTAVDLTGLGAFLFETPIPATALVGVFLLLSPRTPRGTGYFLAWAGLPVLSNGFYWHHGFHLGPRMLYEAAPAWIVLSVMAALTLTAEGEPEEGPADDGSPSGGDDDDEHGEPEEEGRRRIRGAVRVRDLVLWTLVASVAGVGFLLPNRLANYRWPPETLSRISTPRLPSEDPALVFVHGSWTERISSRLQASGMRLDSIETALRRNDVCALSSYAADRFSRGGSGSSLGPGETALDFELLADTPSHLKPVSLSEGNRILVDPTLPLTSLCRWEAHADRFGIISLAPLIWQGDLPGLEEGRPMFVRDLGPEQNRPVLEAFPDRRPYLLMTPAPDSEPQIRDYDEGMALIWGEEPP